MQYLFHILKQIGMVKAHVFKRSAYHESLALEQQSLGRDVL
jgi:hypothetical protein